MWMGCVCVFRLRRMQLHWPKHRLYRQSTMQLQEDIARRYHHIRLQQQNQSKNRHSLWNSSVGPELLQSNPKRGSKQSMNHLDSEANQSVNSARKDHDVDLISRNERDANSQIVPLRIDDVRGRLSLFHGDITKFAPCTVEAAVVNAAHEMLTGGGGVDQAIHYVAGPELRMECESIPFVSPGVRCPTGESRLTKGYLLPSKYCIHTVVSGGWLVGWLVSS